MLHSTGIIKLPRCEHFEAHLWNVCIFDHVPQSYNKYSNIMVELILVFPNK
jgi:hypothetical protein